MGARWLAWLLLLGLTVRAEEIALVPPGQAWRYALGTSPPSVPAAAWREPTFDDSTWLEGPSGFGSSPAGYLESTPFPAASVPYVAAFFRTRFTLAAPNEIGWLVLRLDYDDGFVAYLNGVEVARRGFAPGLEIAFDTPALTLGRTWGEEVNLTAFTNLLAPGTNLLAVEVHKSSAQESVLGLSAELLANFTRGPLVQDAAKDHIQIIWKTPVAADTRVDFGTHSVDEFTVWDTNRVTTHAVRLTNLLAGTTYLYRVTSRAGDQRVASPVGQFRTLKPSGPIRFVVVGDTGLGSLPQFEIARVMREAQPDLVLHVGDVLYQDVPYVTPPPSLFDLRCFSVYREQMRSTPFFAVCGNHDLYSGDAAFLDAFYFPTNTFTGTEHYYSFDHGDVHFSALFVPQRFMNSLFPQYYLGEGSAQFQWLTHDLARSTQPWKVVFFHIPLDTSGLHRWDTDRVGGEYDRLELQRFLLPVLEACGVQVVFTGHDHAYERFAPMHGVHLVVSGGGGARLYNVSQRAPASAQYRSVYHCLKVTVDADTLQIQALDAAGAVFDDITLQRVAPAPRVYRANGHSPVLPTRPADDQDGNVSGQVFDFAGEPIPTVSGQFADLGRLRVNNDGQNLYLGLERVMLWPNQDLFLFVESPCQPGVTNLDGLGDARVDPAGQGGEGLDFLENLAFTNFAPTIGCILGDELADGTFRSFTRPGAAFNAGQGVFRLDSALADVPGARVQQFNQSPQVTAEPAEQNADFIEVAIPLSELGGLQGGDIIRVGAVVGLAGVTTNLDQQTRELDRAFLGYSLAGSGLGPVRLEGLAVELAPDPDPDSDGLTTGEEMELGTDPAKPDTDGDGLLDGWEVRHRLSPLSAAGKDGAQGNPDGDGLANAAEQAAGTDPCDATSALRMQIARQPDGSLRISWDAVAGRTYQLQLSTNPAAGFLELPLAGFPRTAASAVETIEVEPAPSARSTLFFRIRLVE